MRISQYRLLCITSIDIVKICLHSVTKPHCVNITCTITPCQQLSHNDNESIQDSIIVHDMSP